jgi:hypothetical protein
LQGDLRRVQVGNLSFELLVIGPELLNKLPGAGNIEISDVETNDVRTDSDQYRDQE